jgi:hypothetical protein
MKRCSGKHNDAAAFVVFRGDQLCIGSRRWHDPDRFATVVRHRFNCYIVGL